MLNLMCILTEQQLPTRRLLNTLSKNPRRGGGGGWSSIKSGVGPPPMLNTFNSLKHSVSII